MYKFFCTISAKFLYLLKYPYSIPVAIDCSFEQEVLSGAIWYVTWLVLPFEGRRYEALSSHFEVEGIQTLVLLSPEGKVIMTGRAALSADPEGRDFSNWGPKPPGKDFPNWGLKPPIGAIERSCCTDGILLQGHPPASDGGGTWRV